MKPLHPIGNLLFMLVMVVTGCKPDTDSGASAKATWEYWQRIHEVGVDQKIGILFSAIGTNVSLSANFDQSANACEEAVKALQSRIAIISVLPVMDVDTNLTSHALHLVKVDKERAELLLEIGKLSSQGRSLTSGQELVFDFLSSLLRHANEGNEALGNAFFEQLASKAKIVGNAKPAVENLKLAAYQLSQRVSALNIEEMQVRIALSKRFGREFPPSLNYPPKQAKQVMESEAEKKDTEEVLEQQMMRDLIGRQVRVGFSVWKFEHLSEYQSFQSLRRTMAGEDTIYVVATHVKGASGTEHHLRLRLIYQRERGRMILKDVQLR